MRPAPTDWHAYQLSVRDFFQTLGMSATCDVEIVGARTRHDIDVVVEFSHAGLSLRWLVECKRHHRSISKLHVLALRTIVEDVGADRGILVSESAFQRGAYEAAVNSNVTLTTFSELQVNAARHLDQARAAQMPLRLALLHRRYWAIPKAVREAEQLRPAVYSIGYSGGVILDIASEVLLSALAAEFPPNGTRGSIYRYYHDRSISNLSEAVDWLEFVLDDLEARLDRVVSSS